MEEIPLALAYNEVLMVPRHSRVESNGGEALGQLSAGLRSGMSYCASDTLGAMWRNGRFVRQTEAGLRESGPHSVEQQNLECPSRPRLSRKL